MFEKICQDCGGDFVSKTRNTRYCPNCIKIRQSQYAKEHNLCRSGQHHKPRKEKVAPQKKPKEAICDSYCYGCYYLLGGNDRPMICDYIEKEDKRRPCPAGKGCTVKKTISQHIAEKKQAEKLARIRQVECQICGKVFETTDQRRKNCSAECLRICRSRARTAWGIRQREAKHGKETEPTAGSV